MIENIISLAAQLHNLKIDHYSMFYSHVFILALLELCASELSPVFIQKHQIISTSPQSSICYVEYCKNCHDPTICIECTRPMLCCSRNCRNCINSTCQQCQQGFSLVNNLCVLIDACSHQLSNCLLCNRSICTICKTGFYLLTQINQCSWQGNIYIQYQSSQITCQQGFYDEGGQCQQCLPRCLNCSSGSNCYQCSQSYYFTQQIANQSLCFPCPLGCSTCINSTYCSNCTASFTFYLGYCLSCILPNCAICSYTNSTCLSCQPSFFLNQFACTPCPQNCLNCTNATECYLCNAGFWLILNTCTACAQGCSNCTTGIESCIACLPGYFQQANSCQPCSSFCVSCNNTLTCLECQQTFFLNSSFICVPCFIGCLECDNSPYNCSLCKYKNYFSTIQFPFLYGVCTPCPNLCDACLNSSLCYSCQMSAYLAIIDRLPTCLSCSQNITNCQICIQTQNSTLSCQFCTPGFFLNSSPNNSATCIACLPSCSLCTSLDACQICNSGFFLMNGNTTCSSCSQNCAQCSNLLLCTQCNPSYFLSNNNSCAPCNPNCANCSISASNCTSCKSQGQTFLNNVCVSCLSNCNYCPSTELCYSCISSLYFLSTQGNCQRCETSCTQCTNSSNCFQCLGTQILYNNQCYSCPSKCTNCYFTSSSILTCSSCESGFYLDAATQNTSCVACAANCSNCVNNISCISCTKSSLFYDPSFNQCIPCPGSICLSCINSSFCTQCSTKYSVYLYYLFEGICLPCSQFIQNCLNCTIDVYINFQYCQQCQSGFYSQNGVCLPCESNCLQCTGQSDCSNCAPGTNSGSDGVCLPCQTSNCESCSVHLTSCYLCMDGYVLNKEECNPCPVNCLSCTTNGLLCNGCFQNSYFNSSSSLCYPCLPFCINCTNSYSCSNCLNGFYVNPSGTGPACLPCPLNCAFCNIIQGTSILYINCQQCQTGFYLTYVFPSLIPSCQSCPENCQYCSVKGQSLSCVMCAAGFYQSNSNCFSCPSSSQSQNGVQVQINSCLNCTNSSYCLNCISGYFEINGNCFPCSTGCSKCNNQTACSLCASGFYLDGLFCRSCSNSSICITCQSSNACSSCIIGYYLSTQICLLCTEGCSACSSPTECSSCIPQYFLNYNLQCVPCLGLCQTCLSMVYCLSCNIGAFYNSTQASCSSCPANCMNCSNALNCDVCENGYRSFKGLCSVIPTPPDSNERSFPWWGILLIAVLGIGMIVTAILLVHRFCVAKPKPKPVYVQLSDDNSIYLTNK